MIAHDGCKQAKTDIYPVLVPLGTGNSGTVNTEKYFGLAYPAKHLASSVSVRCFVA